LSKRKVNSKKIAISIILTVSACLVLAAHLPMLAFSQLPFLPNSQTNANSNHRSTHSNNNKISGSEAANSSSLNKLIKTTKPKPKSLTSQTYTIKVTENISYKGADKFGIKEIYLTKKSGREWYINMANPRNDPIFSLGSNQSIIKQNSSSSAGSNNNDISWRITNPKVRMHVDTPPGSPQWKNVEITGYVKVNNTNITTAEHHQNDIPNHIAWLARSGVHTDKAPCNGTDLSGSIDDDGSVGWKKEIWFTGGYTNESAQAKPTSSIVGRWIGWKTVVYNIDNDEAVKMESYLDDKNNNHWARVTNLTDSGGWYADTSDKKFYRVDCGKPKDYIVTNSGPMIYFRADNMILDFKDLSVREIDPPPDPHPLSK
jgi:hypothetical protein